MAKQLGCLFIFVNLLQIFQLILGENDNLQQKFTSKCDDLCIVRNESIVEDAGKAECLRGCQYFNIEFLVNARNKDKIIDLNQLVERCGSSCREAYTDDKLKKEQCFRGCNEMMTLQSKAPFVNGWLVYMGATDRNMVLLQPDFDIPSKEDWVLLDSMFRANDYDYDPNLNSYEKIVTDSRGHIQTVPRYMGGGREHFTINYCIPTWMWMLPLLVLVAFIWIHYSNYIYSVFIREGLEHEFGITNANDGVAVNMLGDKKFPHDEDFVVGSDFYFYPTPAVPPPKYNEAAEAILMGSSDDEDDPVAGNKANDSSMIKAKKSCCNGKKNSVVDI